MYPFLSLIRLITISVNRILDFNIFTTIMASLSLLTSRIYLRNWRAWSQSSSYFLLDDSVADYVCWRAWSQSSSYFLHDDSVADYICWRAWSQSSSYFLHDDSVADYICRFVRNRFFSVASQSIFIKFGQ